LACGCWQKITFSANTQRRAWLTELRTLKHGAKSARTGHANNQALTLFNSKEVSKYVLAGTGF
jgi:hypothetical protein